MLVWHVVCFLGFLLPNGSSLKEMTNQQFGPQLPPISGEECRPWEKLPNHL